MRKNILLFLFVSLWFTLPIFAQAATINKGPGKDVQFQWDYLVANEASISGYDLILLAKGSNPIEVIAVAAIAPALRVTPAIGTPGAYKVPLLGGQYFYVARAFFNDTTTGTPVKISSADSNEVLINVVVLPVVTNFRAK